jgi:hypothetical protein
MHMKNRRNTLLKRIFMKIDMTSVKKTKYSRKE